ncbi:HAMP domain-containing histidine kinase [Candidatus Uhrbacteria bacterium]|nr:HAMP domain-containing histidine kinase [Candidatus Uhrbacteria bacterium]
METKINEGSSRRLTYIGGSIVLAAIIVIDLVSWFLYQYTVTLLTDNLRQRLLSIATTQVSNIDPIDIQSLQNEEDWKKPAWRKVVNQLKMAKNNNDNIVFMYIFRKANNDPSRMVFVADAESINPYANTDDDPTNDVDANGDGMVDPDGADQLQWPGQDYPEPPSEAFQAYEGPLTNRELYSDSFGEVLTGYAPIKNDNGETIAVLGTDIKTNDFFTVTRQTLYPFLLFIIFLVLAIVILATALIKIWNKRVEIFAELDRQKDELLSIVSHQLATPITSVKWYVEMLMDGDLGTLTKEQKEHIHSMDGIFADLSDLVSMILDVSRIQLGRVQISKQDLDLKEFFKEILEIIEPKAKEKPVVFNVSIPQTFPAAKLDKRYTHMTIENLLTNAIKYTPANGTVDFKVEIRGKEIYCHVKDTGCGIPKADQDKIFEKLFRASNVRNTVDGNGFGLYVAKGAIEAQGGKIWFESAENKGTSFFITLPLNETVVKSV